MKNFFTIFNPQQQNQIQRAGLFVAIFIIILVVIIHNPTQGYLNKYYNSCENINIKNKMLTNNYLKDNEAFSEEFVHIIFSDKISKLHNDIPMKKNDTVNLDVNSNIEDNETLLREGRVDELQERFKIVDKIREKARSYRNEQEKAFEKLSFEDSCALLENLLQQNKIEFQRISMNHEKLSTFIDEIFIQNVNEVNEARKIKVYFDLNLLEWQSIGALVSWMKYLGTVILTFIGILFTLIAWLLIFKSEKN